MIVSEPKKTTMYMTLKSPNVIHIVKRLLKTLFEKFGNEVLKNADKSLHPMNLKDKTRIEKWQLACDFQTDLFTPEAPKAKDDDGKRPRRKGPARLENLGDWANEAEIVPAASSAIVVMQNYVKQAADSIDTLTKQLSGLQLKEQRIKHAKNDAKKRSQNHRRIEQLEATLKKTKDQDKQLDLGYEISKLYTELDDTASDEVLDEIEYEKGSLQKQLGKVKLEKDLLDEYCAEAVLLVLDSAPAVPLYVITKMKEEDRRDMIIDRLPVDMPQKVRAYKKAKDEGSEVEAKRQFGAISKTILNRSLELVGEGYLPDHTKNSPNRMEFLNRTTEVTKVVTGTAPDREMLKKTLTEEKKKQCAYCDKKCETLFWNLDENKPASKPDKNTAAHIIGLCDSACERSFRQMPFCHKCYGDDRQYFQIKPGEGLVNPSAMLQVTPLVNSCVDLKSQISKASGAARKELEKELEKVQSSAAIELERDTCLPNLWCVKCDVQCWPRDIGIMRPDYHDLEKILCDNRQPEEAGKGKEAGAALLQMPFSDPNPYLQPEERHLKGRKPFSNQH